MSSSITDQTLAAIEIEIPRLRRYARNLTRNRDEADDLVQDCLMRAVDKLDTWRPGSNLRAWLFTILRNGYISKIRHRRRTHLEAIDDDDAAQPSVSGGQELRLQLRELTAAFRLLSEDHRHALYLVAVEGLRYEEAADILDVPVGTVRSRLSRARRGLKQLLEGDAPDHVGVNRMIVHPGPPAVSCEER